MLSLKKKQSQWVSMKAAYGLGDNNSNRQSFRIFKNVQLKKILGVFSLGNFFFLNALLLFQSLQIENKSRFH